MTRALAAAAAVVLIASAAQAQPIVTVPQPSPRARVEQTVGVTELSVTYNRPAVNKRKVWGGLVPWGEVWRAGANENTVLASSTEFTVEGHKLPAGRYGLHLLPAEGGAWQLIVSTIHTGWGSYGYDQKEDAFRAAVKPEAAPDVERLQYDFDDVTDNGATLALRWEKLRVPIQIAVDTNEATFAKLRAELRGLPQFFPRAYSEAAGWLIAHDTHLDEAGQWLEKGNGISPTFNGLMAKSKLLEKKGDAAGAQAARERAATIATEVELNVFGYTLLQAGKTAEALAAFRKNAKDHPESWNVHDSLGEALEKAGEKKEAKESYRRALKLVKDEQQKARLQKVLANL